MEHTEGFNPIKSIKKASSFTKLTKSGSNLKKIKNLKKFKKTGKISNFVKKNPKKVLAGAAVGGGLGYTAIESGMKGTNFVDELQDNIGGVAGTAIGSVGNLLGVSQETIDFIKNNWKNILFGILFLYLYMSFGFIGLMIVLIIYLVIKYDGVKYMLQFYKYLRSSPVGVFVEQNLKLNNMTT